MNITIDRRESYVMARVVGSIDSTTVDDFFHCLQPLTELQDFDLLVDLSETDYIISNALDRIIQLHQAANKNSNRMVLVSPSLLVHSALTATKLDSYLTVAEDVNSAIATLSRLQDRRRIG